jgi:hypothetical protein
MTGGWRSSDDARLASGISGKTLWGRTLAEGDARASGWHPHCSASWHSTSIGVYAE